MTDHLEQSLEFDSYDVPGIPNLDGAIKELASWREFADGDVVAEIDKILAMLQPEPKRALSVRQFHHRGHWKSPIDHISITPMNTSEPLEVAEVWVYDRKNTHEHLLNGKNVTFDFPIEIWGRAILDKDVMNTIVDGDARFDLCVHSGENGVLSRFILCVVTRFTSCNGQYKADFIVMKAENFGYSGL